MKNSLDKNAKWLLLFGILLTFLFPLLLPLLNKTGIGNFGVVGDAIGGMVIPPKRAASKSRINTSPAFSAGRVSLLKPSYAFALE